MNFRMQGIAAFMAGIAHLADNRVEAFSERKKGHPRTYTEQDHRAKMKRIAKRRAKKGYAGPEL